MSDPMGERAEIANRIRTLRKSRGRSIKELAELTAISQGYLSDVERGKSSLSGEKLARLAEQLGVTTDYLLSGREEHRTTEIVQIPAGLSEAAETLDLSYAKTIRLLAGKQSIVARRSSSAENEWSKEDWIEFYETVKVYL